MMDPQRMTGEVTCRKSNSITLFQANTKSSRQYSTTNKTQFQFRLNHELILRVSKKRTKTSKFRNPSRLTLKVRQATTHSQWCSGRSLQWVTRACKTGRWWRPQTTRRPGSTSFRTKSSPRSSKWAWSSADTERLSSRTSSTRCTSCRTASFCSMISMKTQRPTWKRKPRWGCKSTKQCSSRCNHRQSRSRSQIWNKPQIRRCLTKFYWKN